MAIPTNAQTTFGVATRGESKRESLEDAIYQTSPTATPFVQKIGRDTATNTKEEWQTHSLTAATSANKHIDADEFDADAITDAARIGNICQILRKDIVTSKRLKAVNVAGASDMLAKQLEWAGMEIMRDLESSCLSNNAAVVGDDTTAPQMAGVGSWLKTNFQGGSGATAPALSDTTYGIPSTAPGTGTDRGLTETHLRTGVRTAFVQGGEPDCAFMSPTNKENLSTYLFTSTSRTAAPYQDFGNGRPNKATALGTIDIWVPDFLQNGLELWADIFMGDEELFITDTSTFELRYLRTFRIDEMGDTGDSDKRMLLCDVTLACHSEQASAQIADIDETTAVAA